MGHKRVRMRNYEVVYIFHPALDEAAVDEKLERFHGLLSGPDGAEVSAVDHWGLRQLAYEIQDQNQGFYVVSHITTEPELLTEFERILKLDDDLMRYLVVISEGEPTSGVSIVAEVYSSGEPDDDDDDDDDHHGDEDEDEYDDGSSPPEFSGGRGRRRRVEGPRIELLNYKDVSTLSRFVTEQGKILPKRTTKVTARFQRTLGTAVKRGRYLALLPYVQSHDR
jgi:small subunit ribosomal protein S6